MKRHYLAAGLALALIACQGDAPTGAPGPLMDNAGAAGATAANPRYIIRFRDGQVDESAQTDRLVREHAGLLVYTYHNAIKGFAAEFADRDIAALARDPSVVAVEADQVMHIIGTQLNPPSWGLDRVDQHPLPLSNSYTFNATGTGVTVYIIDTGIRFTHVDFGGRASPGVDEIVPSTGAVDCNGHGTHVSGTVGGSTYGMAKNVTLVAVRVLACSGSGPTSGVIAGIDWVTGQKIAHPTTPMAANMSLGGGFSLALNAAVTNSVAAGVTYAVAAGNSNADACLESPSSAPNAITVAATTISDARASFSNFGSCVDIFAPGQAIKSDWFLSDTATNTISGTSMASPHVAGAAALYLEVNPAASPASVATALTTNATAGVVTSPGTNSPNLLLYTLFIGGGGPPPPPPPVANYTFSCTGLSCSFDGSGSTALANATYGWSWGDGTPNGSGKTATHTYAAAGTYTVTLTVTDANGTGTRTQQVTVTVPAPVANWTFTCNGLACTFDGSTSTAQPNATYEWRWGDESRPFGTTKVALHTYAAPGSYFVTLRVTDGGGTSTRIQQITVTNAPPPPPVANFTFNCTLLTCSFDGSTSTAQANATYGWAWGDGTPNGSGKTTTHSFAVAGTYSVTLTVTDAGGSSNQAQNVTVSIPAPVANFTFNCTLLSCSFDGSTSTAQPNATYGWVWGDGTPNGSGKTTTHSFAVAGTYGVTLTVTDAGGSSNRTQNVTVTIPAPVANFTFSCIGLACSFDGSSSTAQPNATYGWDFGDGSTGSGKTASHTYGASGTYTVTLTVTDAGGSSNKSLAVTPSVAAPVANFTFSCTLLNCNFDGSSSTAQSNATYSWDFGDGSNGTGKTASRTYAAFGSYNVTLTVTDAGGSNSRTRLVTLTPPVPVANFTFTCTALACGFDGSSSTAQPNATYAWTWGDGTPNGSGKTATHTYAAAGTFNVTLTVTDAGGSGNRTQAVTVTIPPPVANFTYSCNGLVCNYDGSSSSAQPNATYEYRWGDETRPFGSTKLATHTYAAPGTYFVSLIVTDAGGTNRIIKPVTAP